MKLIIVERSKTATFHRLKDTFGDDLNVDIVYDRRVQERRQRSDPRDSDRRGRERRRLSEGWNGRDYIVIEMADPK